VLVSGVGLVVETRDWARIHAGMRSDLRRTVRAGFRQGVLGFAGGSL